MGKFAMGAAALAALTLTGWAAPSAQFRGEVDPTSRRPDMSVRNNHNNFGLMF